MSPKNARSLPSFVVKELPTLDTLPLHLHAQREKSARRKKEEGEKERQQGESLLSVGYLSVRQLFRKEISWTRLASSKRGNASLFSCKELKSTEAPAARGRRLFFPFSLSFPSSPLESRPQGEDSTGKEEEQEDGESIVEEDEANRKASRPAG